jgi:hypothetical protein
MCVCVFQNGNLSNLRLKTGKAIIEGSQHASPGFTKNLKPGKDDLEFDLELDPMLSFEQSSGMDLNLDLDLDLDQSELDPGSELDSEIQAKPELELESELETDAQTEPETEEEPELEPEPEPEPETEPEPEPERERKTRTRSQSPWRNYFTAYRFGSSNSQSRAPPQTRPEKRKPHNYPNSP